MGLKEKILEVYQRIENQLAQKQDALTAEQLAAINSVSSKANISDLRYSLVTPSMSTSTTSVSNDTISGTLQDRAVNSIVSGSPVAYVHLTLPPAVSGKGRDFFVRLTVTSTTVPEVSFSDPSGVTPTFDVDDEEWSQVEQGVNIMQFTETNQA